MMTPSPFRNSHGHPAPCQSARRLLIIAAGASLLMVAATAADCFLRAAHQDRPAGPWMKVLALSAPALWPAGSAMRHPETVHPGVDVRFVPGLGTIP